MQDTNTEQVEDIQKDFGYGGAGEVKRWKAELKLAEKNDKDWIARADKVMKRYRDERSAAEKNDTKFNILWSNTQTILPALYMNTPNPVVTRRFKDKNDLAMSGAKLLERAVKYSIEADECDFDGTMEAVCEDYQLPGRAVTRIIYKPHMTKKRFPAEPTGHEMTFEPNLIDPTNPIAIQGAPIYPEGTLIDEVSGEGYTEEDVVDYEETYPVPVYWRDFRMGKARTWKKVPWVGFRSYMTRKELHDRFDENLGAEVVKKIPLNHTPDKFKEMDDDEGSVLLKKAEVWEIWDKVERQVIWVCPDYNETPLDKDDPHLKLHGFYPCTEPLIMTKTTGNMEPVPEYIQYQDQARELDETTKRIGLLTQAVRVAGVYDGNATALEKLLSDTDSGENKLYPLSDWNRFQDKGGLDGSISWLPIEQIIKTLRELYQSRDMIKQDLYEITGIADIVRGASDPRETMGAQKLKGKWVAQRLKKKQKLVAEHARKVIALMVEVIAEQFSADTLYKITGEQPAPEVVELLRNDPMRSYMISIETDSTIAVDEEEEKRSRVEFLSAASSFLEKAIMISQGQPLLTPLLGEMLMFGVRGFRAGRDLEEEFDRTMEMIKQDVQQKLQQKQNQPPPKDPAAVKAETDAVIKLEDHKQEMVMDQENHQQELQQSAETHQQQLAQEAQNGNSNSG